ncbi:SRPBCC family protein [Streptomyces sp. O3]
MSAIKETVDIARRPEEVFSYMTDPSHLPEWQESAVSAHTVGDGPLTVGSRFETVRRMGRREMPMTMEVVELEPPRRWHFHGVDGPIRGDVTGTIEPLDDGERSRMTFEVDFETHGMGKVIAPLVARPQIRKQLPADQARLKALLEA